MDPVIKVILDNVNAMLNAQNNIANDVWPDGWKGNCSKCGKPFTYTREECAYYLAHGWPKCSCKTKPPEVE